MSASSFFETFLSKLKEQSFTIILLVGIMIYQHQMFKNSLKEHDKLYEKQIEEYKTSITKFRSILDSKEKMIIDINKEERTRMIEYEKELRLENEKYITKFIESLEKKKATK